MDDDDTKTFIDRRPLGSTSATLVDILPDVPEQPPFEVTFDRVTVDLSAPEHVSPLPTLEVWTANRIYMTDASLTCYEVIDRQSGASEPKHKFLGTRLNGGQRKYGKTLHTTKPFPVAGTEAVFTRPTSSGQPGAVHLTSRVERVVLHVRVTTLLLDNDDAFGDVTNAMLLPSRFRLPED